MDKIIVRCPFCGAWAFKPIRNDKGRWCVMCENCEAIGPATATRGGAIKAWLIPTTPDLPQRYQPVAEGRKFEWRQMK